MFIKIDDRTSEDVFKHATKVPDLFSALAEEIKQERGRGNRMPLCFILGDTSEKDTLGCHTIYSLLRSAMSMRYFTFPLVAGRKNYEDVLGVMIDRSRAIYVEKKQFLAEAQQAELFNAFVKMIGNESAIVCPIDVVMYFTSTSSDAKIFKTGTINRESHCKMIVSRLSRFTRETEALLTRDTIFTDPDQACDALYFLHCAFAEDHSACSHN